MDYNYVISSAINITHSLLDNNETFQITSNTVVQSDAEISLLLWMTTPSITVKGSVIYFLFYVEVSSLLRIIRQMPCTAVMDSEKLLIR